MHREIQQPPGRATLTPEDAAAMIMRWGAELGFQEIGISDTELSAAESGLLDWLAAGCHGDMDYMARHGLKRAGLAEVVERPL